MPPPPQRKPRKKKTKGTKASNSPNNKNPKGAAARPKRKSAPAGSLAASSTIKQNRGRSATKKKVNKTGSRNSSFNGSIPSLEPFRSRSRDSMASSSSGGGGGPLMGRGSGNRPKSLSNLDPSCQSTSHSRSPSRRLDMAGRTHQRASLRRNLSNPNLPRNHSNSSLAGGRIGSQRSARSFRSVSTDESASSFAQRRLNRMNARMKRSQSPNGLSQDGSRSSIFSDEGTRRSFGRLSATSGSGDLHKIIGKIEAGDPDVLRRKKSQSRFQSWATRNRLASSRSLDSSSGKTMSSLGSEEFPPDETIWVSGLRYIRILPPTPRECKSDRIIRYMIWGAIILDFVAAMVSVLTYDSVTMCCGKPIFELLESRINWNEFVRISTYLYLLLIFLEVIPVFNKEIPLNLINPLIGFTITFAMFFDDRISEAISMWAIEALAIGFEAVTTFLKQKQHQRHIERIEECEEEIRRRNNKKKAKPRHEGSVLYNYASEVERENEERRKRQQIKADPYTDLESLSAGSLYNTADAEVNIFRIERERRTLAAGLKNEEINLRYHYIGSVINITLVLITLSFIIGIGKNGGLCISNFEAPPIFKDDQLQRCPACAEATSVCEVCDTTGGTAHQCYYPYKL